MNRKGQSIIEFCFAVCVLMLLLFGMVQTVRWVMTEMVGWRYDHDITLTRFETIDLLDLPDETAGYMKPMVDTGNVLTYSPLLGGGIWADWEEDEIDRYDFTDAEIQVYPKFHQVGPMDAVLYQKPKK